MHKAWVLHDSATRNAIYTKSKHKKSALNTDYHRINAFIRIQLNISVYNSRIKQIEKSGRWVNTRMLS